MGKHGTALREAAESQRKVRISSPKALRFVRIDIR